MANQYARIELTGADGLIELLQTLPEKQLLPAIAKGMRSVGSKVVRDARKRLTKNHGYDTGALKRSLGVRKVLTLKRESKVILYMGPRRGFATTGKGGRKHDPFFIGHLVEFGHRIAVGRSGRSEKGHRLERKNKKGKVYRIGVATSAGVVPAYPSIGPAVQANKGEFNKQMVEKITEVIRKARASGK